MALGKRTVCRKMYLSASLNSTSNYRSGFAEFTCSFILCTEHALLGHDYYYQQQSYRLFERTLVYSIYVCINSVSVACCVFFFYFFFVSILAKYSFHTVVRGDLQVFDPHTESRLVCLLGAELNGIVL